MKPLSPGNIKAASAAAPDGKVRPQAVADQHKKAVRKHSPSLWEALQRVRKDPYFKIMTAETQDLVEGLMQQVIEAAKAKDKEAPSDAEK